MNSKRSVWTGWKLGSIGLGTLGLLGLPAAAFGGVLITATIDGNDCSGFFGQGFRSCQIFNAGDEGDVKISPVIAKYDVEEDEWETNSALYPNIDGSEFSFGTGSEGTWNYTPGDGDPGVRFWAAKGGNFFNLFWVVGEDEAGLCDGSGVSLLTLDCLNAAQVVTSGSWITPTNPNNGNLTGLSHLTFYNEKAATKVPEPATLGMLGLGLLGLAAATRRRRSK
ncbi:hypothetical protein J2T57_004341 [Natronocella acetinitrilica]|uniref:Ice-binding protein C-terminal domain-containing protein n=2 Tax=Natronocella acetinitrilica TaxID=414046 RepID=A0AAE3KI96_9GAMM|nr:hypothetical protein [Natronocella acetinitrilica]